MKKTALLIVLLLAVAAYAVVELNFTIPDDYVTRVVAALRACENTHVSIHFQGSRDPNDPNTPDFTLDVDYRIDSDPNNPAEDDRDYGKRFIRSFVRFIVEAYEKKLETQKRQEAIDAIPIVDVNVPDGIIE